MQIKRTNATACVLVPNVKTGDPHVYAIGGFSEGGQVSNLVPNVPRQLSLNSKP